MKRMKRAILIVAAKRLAKRRKAARAAMKCFHNMIDLVTQNAKGHGYCIAVHGSLLRDIDLVAVPWADKVAKPAVLHDSIFKLCRALYPRAYTHPSSEKKPHRRLAWVINLGVGGTYIDLSVIRP